MPDILDTFGPVSGWVTAGGVVGMFGLLLRFLPKWVEATANKRLSDAKIAQDLRDELLEKLHECEVKHQELHRQNENLRSRVILLEDQDRRKTIALTLLMNEVSRLDPDSDIILRAKGVLEVGIILATPTNEEINEALHNLEDEK